MTSIQHLVAAYDDAKIEALRQDERIVRNQAKIRSVIRNANAFLDMEASGQSFSDYIWSFVDGEPIQNAWTRNGERTSIDGDFGGDEQGFEASGFQFCGAYDLLRIHAGGRTGERSCHWLFQMA